MGIVVGGANVPEISLNWASPEAHDSQSYADLFTQADKLRIHAEQALQHANSALRFIEQSDWSPIWQNELINAVSHALNDALALEKNEIAATDVLGISLEQGKLQSKLHWKALLDSLPDAYSGLRFLDQSVRWT